MLFNDQALGAAVAHELAAAQIPADHRNAFALVATTSGGVKGVLTTRVNDIWEIDAVFAVAKGHPFEGGVQIKASW